MRSWVPHLACCALLALAVCAWSIAHDTDEDLRARAYDQAASPLARVAAMRTLATRPSASAEAVQDLWDEAMLSVAPQVRLLAAGTDLLRFGAHDRWGTPPTPPPAAEAYLATLTKPSADEWLWFIVYRRKVGGMQVGSRRRLDLREAAWTIQALQGEAPPQPEAKSHVLQRAQNGMRRPR